MSIRKGWAPPRKRPKRLEKKMRKAARLHAGYRPNYPIVLTAEQSEELVRQLAAIESEARS